MKNIPKPLATLIGVAVMFTTITIAVLIAQSFVPPEKTPSRVELPDGSVRFVLQSKRESVSWPAGTAGLVIACLILHYLLPSIGRQDPEEKRRPHIVFRVIGYVLIAFLVFLFAKVLLLDPLYSFRSLVLTSDELSMSSLYRTWSIPLSEIRDTHIDRNDRSGRGGLQTDFCYKIRSAAGSRHSSIVITCSRPSAKRDVYAKFLDSMDAELKSRLKEEGANPRGNAVN